MTKQEAFLSSLFLGICAGLLTVIFTHERHVIGFSFLSTFGGYQFLRHQPSKSYLPALSGAFALLIWKFTVMQMLLVGISSALSVLYQTPYGISLRNSSWLKPISISFAWTLNTVLLANANNFEAIPNEHSVVFSTLSIFVLTFILSLYYDLKDATLEEHRNSLAVRLGTANTLRIAIVSCVIVVLFGLAYMGSITKETVTLSGATVYILNIHSRVSKNKGTAVGIDACFVVYALLYLGCEYFV